MNENSHRGPVHELAWQEAVEALRPYVVKIGTPDHDGTGFLFAFAAGGGICGFATAAHALAHAHAWEQPIRLEHTSSGTVRMLHPNERGIVIDEANDTAALVLLRDDLPLPTTLLPSTPEGTTFRVGVEIGWVGYPAVARDQLCFFSGRISAWLEAKGAYLVDGVGINGVSGGPAFRVEESGQPVLLGVMSAYILNKATGPPLPGLSLVQHIGHLEKIVKNLQSLESDIARARE